MDRRSSVCGGGWSPAVSDRQSGRQLKPGKVTLNGPLLPLELNLRAKEVSSRMSYYVPQENFHGTNVLI